MMTFDLLVPTRGRPANMHRLVESVAVTAAHPERICFWFYIDTDDAPSAESIPALRAEFGQVRIEGIRSPRVPLTTCYNILQEYAGDGILWSGGDDIVFRTPGWDELVEAEFLTRPDHLLLVYGDDCLQHENLATHPFISRAGVNLLGYFCPETPEGVNLTDIWLHRLYGTVGRLVYRPDVITEHMHWLRKLADYDDTYKREYETNFPHVLATLEKHTPRLVRDAHRLRAAILRFTGDPHADAGRSDCHARPPRQPDASAAVAP